MRWSKESPRGKRSLVMMFPDKEGVSQLSGVVPNSVGTPGRSITH